MYTVHKIAIITTFYPPHIGKEARFTYYLAKELTRLGIEICVITTGENKTIKERKVDGVQVVYLPSKRHNERFIYPRFRNKKEIHNIITKFKPDCVVLNDYYRMLSYFGAKSATSLNIHTILISHITGHVQIKNKVIAWVFRKYERMMINRLRKKPIDFAGTSIEQNDWLRKEKLSPKYVITDAVDTDMIPIPGMRRKLGIKQEEVIICLSQEIVSSNLDEVVNAFSLLNSWSGPKTYLVVYGGKRQSRKYKNLDIIFVGDLAREDRLSLLEDSDIYLTINEKGRGLPIDILEAGICNNAVICINRSGRCLVIDDDSIGFVVRQGNKEVLTERMQKLRLRSNFRRKMSEKLRGNIELKYNWNQSALALIDAISEQKTIRRDNEWKRLKRIRDEKDIFID